MPSGGQNKISRDDLLDALQDLASELGDTPTRAEMDDVGDYSGSAYRREFGSWNEAVEAANLNPNHEPKKEKSEHTCDWCGSTVYRHDSQVTGSNFYCSRECKHEYQEAEVVGKGHHQWARVECRCEYCGTIIYRKPSHLETREKVFCDMTCMGQYRQSSGNPNWKGGLAEDYGQNWEAVRQEAIERDNQQCQRCGLSSAESLSRYDKSLHVHHLVPRRDFIEDGEFDAERANQLSNLVTLCPSCHRRWEKIPLRPSLLSKIG